MNTEFPITAREAAQAVANCAPILPTTDSIVLMVLVATGLTYNTVTVAVSQSQVAYSTGLTLPTVRASLRRLVTLGLIEYHPPGWRSPATYVLRMQAIQALARRPEQPAMPAVRKRVRSAA